MNEDPKYSGGGTQKKRMCVEDILWKTWRTIKVDWEWAGKRGNNSWILKVVW